jgi:hypothetical protein
MKKEFLKELLTKLFKIMRFMYNFFYKVNLHLQKKFRTYLHKLNFINYYLIN